MIAAVFVVALASLARAETPESLRKRGELRWGADYAGGGPYVVEENGKLSGFEYDLAEYLARELGVRAVSVNGTWENLPQKLNRDDIDIVLNGYEWFPEREAEWASTIPYYVYKLQLLVRKDNDSIRNWDDLKPGRDGRRKRLSVLGASAAERYLRKRFGDEITLEPNEEGVTSAMAGVRNGQFAATVQDNPCPTYYLPREFPELHAVGDPVPASDYPYYVIYTRRNDPELVAALNAAILKGLRDGTLRRIYEKHGIWNADQEALSTIAASWPPQTASAPPDLLAYGQSLTLAAGMTVFLSVVSMPLAMLIGMLVAVGRLYGPRWLSLLLTAYVEFLRGTPLLMQLFFIYFILPQAGISLLPLHAGILGLAINYSAYESENYRAGILAVPQGQTEAALALGMTTPTALYRVILPQAFRIIVPLEINNFIALFKDSSVCLVIGVVELTGRYKQLSNNHPGLVLALAAMTATLYMLMSYPLALATRRLEKRLGRVAV